MTSELVRLVRARAEDRCKYCRIPQWAFPFRFQIDDIIAEQHGGETVASNLALACAHCKRYKGPNIASFDARSDEPIRLFHPRRDTWSEHFQWLEAFIFGRTPVGVGTVQVLAMNLDEPVRFRRASCRN